MTDYLLVLIGRVAPAFRQVLISGRGRAIGMIIADGDIALTANARLLPRYMVPLVSVIKKNSSTHGRVVDENDVKDSREGYN